MAKKKKIKQGLIYYEISHKEQLKLIQVGSFGNRCDSCGKTVQNVYWVPVLCWGMCEKCFNDWKGRAEYFEEDEWYSDKMISWIEKEFEKLEIKLEEEGKMQ